MFGHFLRARFKKRSVLFNDPEERYSIGLLSIDPNTILTEKLIPKPDREKPIFIQQGQRFFMYGYKNNKWVITPIKMGAWIGKVFDFPGHYNQVFFKEKKSIPAYVYRAIRHANLHKMCSLAQLDDVEPTEYVVRVNAPSIINLAFSGGGAKCYVYNGVLKYLEEHGELDAIQTVSGSSAGAITALFFALGLKSKDIETCIARQFDPNLIRAKDGSGLRQALETVIKTRIRDFFKLTDSKLKFKSLSQHDQNCLLEIYCIVSEKNDVKNNNLEKITFAHLALLNKLFPQSFKKLLVTATDNEKKDLVVFSNENTPDVSLASAVRASGSLPYVFYPEKIIINGHERTLIDGGMIDNLPFSLLNNRCYRGDIPVGHRNDWGQNPQTLCLGVASEQNRNIILHYRDKTPSWSWRIAYLIGGLITNIPLYGALDQDMWRRLENQHSLRTILIDPMKTSVADFYLSDEKKKSMMNSGYRAVKQYYKLHDMHEVAYYKYNSLFEMIIGLDEGNLKNLIKKNQWPTYDEIQPNDKLIGFHTQQYHAAMAIRRLLYFPLANHRSSYLQLIQRDLQKIQDNPEEIELRRKNISKILRRILKPLSFVTDFKVKMELEHAVLSKVNYECDQGLLKVAVKFDDKSVSFKKPCPLRQFQASTPPINHVADTRKLFHKMWIKNSRAAYDDVNLKLLREIKDVVLNPNLTLLNLERALDKIILRYQRRTFRILTHYFLPQSVIEAQKIKDSLRVSMAHRFC